MRLHQTVSGVRRGKSTGTSCAVKFGSRLVCQVAGCDVGDGISDGAVHVKVLGPAWVCYTRGALAFGYCLARAQPTQRPIGAWLRDGGRVGHFQVTGNTDFNLRYRWI